MSRWEDRAIDELLRLRWAKTEEALRDEALAVLERVFSLSPSGALDTLSDLQMRKLIQPNTYRKPMAVAQWRWIRRPVSRSSR